MAGKEDDSSRKPPIEVLAETFSEGEFDELDQELVDVQRRFKALSADNKERMRSSIGAERGELPFRPHSQETSVHSRSEVTSVVVDSTPRKITNFSGSSEVRKGEVDYKHWRRAASRIVDDTELSEGRKKVILLQSLVGDAEDAIDLHRDSSCRKLLRTLDKMYGTTADGYDLLATFYQQLQLPSQTSSQYLNQLYVLICEVVEQGGLPMNVMQETLLRQFIRGTWDEDLLDKLKLEDKVDEAPSFPNLIEAVRRVEARRTERKLRQKQVARLNMSATSLGSIDKPAAVDQEDMSLKVESMQRRIKELEDVCQHHQQQATSLENQRSFFCYRCGENEHLAVECSNPPNKDLVEEKSKLRKSKSGNRFRLPQRANVGNKK